MPLILYGYRVLLMKILWLAHRDPLHPRAGGAERTLLEITTRLVLMGHEVVILTVRWKGSKATDILNNVKVIRFGNTLFYHLFTPIFLIKFKPSIAVNDLGQAVPWLSTTVLRQKSIVFFRHLHSRSLPGQVGRPLAKLITSIEKAYFLIYPNRTFVTESSTSKSDLIKIGINEDKIILNPPGVDLQKYNLYDKSQIPTVVYFGGFRKYKRPLETVAIFKEISLRMGEVRFIFIGNGPEILKVKSMVKKCRIDDKTIFTGKLEEFELAKMISQSWLNVHTSITEGWGLSIIEAAASGTPTVAYEVPGVVDTIVNGMNGFKIRDLDREAFVEAALRILNDPFKWETTSRKVAEKYSWDKAADVWSQLIGNLN